MSQLQASNEDYLTLAIKRNKCISCRSKRLPTCTCTGPSAGGDSEAGVSSDASADVGMFATIAARSMAEAQSSEVQQGIQTPALTLNLNERIFNLELVFELLNKKILEIDNNLDLGTLSIRLLFNATSLSKEYMLEMQRYFAVILNELQRFVAEHKLNLDGLGITQDKLGNILALRIALPNPQLYAEFIRRLTANHLLPLQNDKQENNLHPLRPQFARKAKNPEHEEEQRAYKTPRLKIPTDPRGL